METCQARQIQARERRQEAELLGVEVYDLGVAHCAICGEPEGSPYAKSCCTDDQMIEG